MRTKFTTTLEPSKITDLKLLCAEANISCGEAIEHALDLVLFCCKEARNAPQNAPRTAPWLAVGLTEARRRVGSYTETEAQAALLLASKDFDARAGAEARLAVLADAPE